MKRLILALCILLILPVTAASATPTIPTLNVVSTVVSPVLDSAQGLLIDGNLAYVHAANVSTLDRPGQVSIWDTSFSPPKLLGSLPSMSLRASPHGMGLYQGHLYTVASNNGTPWKDAGIAAINVSVSSNPTLTSVLYDVAKLDDAHTLLIDETTGIAWISNSDNNSIAGIDIRDPNNMKIIAYLEDDEKLAQPIGLYREGTILYITGGGGGSDRLTTVDISNPSALKVLGTVQNHALLADAHAVKARNGIAFVAARGASNSFVSINVANPLAPAIIGSVVSPLLDGAHDFVLEGNKAILVAADSDYVVVIDITNPAQMSITASTTAPSLDFPVAIKTIGTNRFMVASWGSSSLTVLTLAETTATPTILPPAPVQSQPLRLTLLDSPILVFNGSSSTIGWTNLGLSKYLPSEAKAVLLNVQFKDTASASRETGVYLRHSALNEYMNASVLGYHVNGIYRLSQVTLPVPPSRIIQYSIEASGVNTGLAIIRIVGWYS